MYYREAQWLHQSSSKHLFTFTKFCNVLFVNKISQVCSVDFFVWEPTNKFKLTNFVKHKFIFKECRQDRWGRSPSCLLGTRTWRQTLRTRWSRWKTTLTPTPTPSPAWTLWTPWTRWTPSPVCSKRRLWSVFYPMR